MKFDAKKLYAQAFAALEVATGRTVVPIQEFVLIEPRDADTVTVKASGNWGQVTLTCECIEAPKVAVCIHAKTLLPVLKTLEGPLSLTKAKGKLAAQLSCGSFYCEIPIQKAEQFPNIAEAPSGGAVFPASKIIEFCGIVDSLCDPQSLKNFIANGMIGYGGAFASNGHMFVAVEDLRIDSPCWVPMGLSDKLAAHVAPDETITLVTSESDLFVVSKNGVFKRLRPSQDPAVYEQLWSIIWATCYAPETGRFLAPSDLSMRISRINGYYVLEISETGGKAIMAGWDPENSGYRYSDTLGDCTEKLCIRLITNLFKKMLQFCNKELPLVVSSDRIIRCSDGSKTVALLAVV